LGLEEAEKRERVPLHGMKNRSLSKPFQTEPYSHSFFTRQLYRVSSRNLNLARAYVLKSLMQLEMKWFRYVFLNSIIAFSA